ncbi:FliM/FliN family flagellar motor switch protein [Desulfospira joergensenii]|uniref:FliM/FliN family flagellar motor switch protein n=1 Tax=Desulfospira joergensenii TaxID=53329 RepID=UPI0003FEB900|nr:FliM/FliN family flagellar motor switch protein [Desulfospira joergensenii]
MPEKYSSLELEFFNLVSSKQIEFEMMMGSRPVRVTAGFKPKETDRDTEESSLPVHLAFEAEDLLFQVSFLKTRFLFDFLETVDSEGLLGQIQPESLPEEVVWAVVESLLSESLGRMESLVNTPITIVSPVSDPIFSSAPLDFELAFMDQGEVEKKVLGLLYLPLKERAMSLLKAAVEPCRPRQMESSITRNMEKIIFFEAGSLVLPLHQVKAIETGDILVPDNWYLKEGQLVMRMNPHAYFCEYHGDEMTAVLRQRKASKTGRAMENIDDAVNEAGEVSDSGTPSLTQTRDLDLELVFEVGQAVMRVEEIEILAEGAVIPLSRKIDQGVPVEVKVMGQKIARGKIVAIGEEIGVQITRTAGDK